MPKKSSPTDTFKLLRTCRDMSISYSVIVRMSGATDAPHTSAIVRATHTIYSRDALYRWNHGSAAVHRSLAHPRQAIIQLLRCFSTGCCVALRSDHVADTHSLAELASETAVHRACFVDERLLDVHHARKVCDKVCADARMCERLSPSLICAHMKSMMLSSNIDDCVYGSPGHDCTHRRYSLCTLRTHIGA